MKPELINELHSELQSVDRQLEEVFRERQQLEQKWHSVLSDWEQRVIENGKWAASGAGGPVAADKTVRIWDLETGKCRATLRGHTNRVTSVTTTPDGKRIVTASLDKSLRVWDSDSQQPLGELRGHTREVCSVNALRDDARALSGGARSDASGMGSFVEIVS